jgi:hypothetical protein
VRFQSSEARLLACATATCANIMGATPSAGSALTVTGKSDGGTYTAGETIVTGKSDGGTYTAGETIQLQYAGGGEYVLYAVAGGVQPAQAAKTMMLPQSPRPRLALSRSWAFATQEAKVPPQRTRE